MPDKIIKIGTRESQLAIWQATSVKNLLKKINKKTNQKTIQKKLKIPRR